MVGSISLKKWMICIMLMLTLTSCNKTSDIVDTESEEVSAVKDPSENALNSEGKAYRLSELPGEITVKEKYNVYSLDNEFTEEMCQSNGLSKETMTQILNDTGTSMYMMPVNEPITEAKTQIIIDVKDIDWPCDNLKYASDDEFELFEFFTLESQKENGVLKSDYEIYETENGKWMIMIDEDIWCLTIINGKQVDIVGENYIEPPTEEQLRDIKEIAASLKYVAD